jgi:PAS domain S-box-containing protein
MRREVEIFRTAVEQAETAIAIVNPDGGISYANSAFHEITGYETSELEGQSVRCLASESFGPEAYDALWDRVGAGETVRREVEQRRKDGGRFVADMSVAPVTVAGDLQQFILVETDITELKSQQQRLQVLNRVVRHNLRNDLNVVKGNISLVMDEIETDQSHEQAERAMQKIDDLLAMSEKARLVNRIVEDADENAVTQTEPLTAVAETLASSLREGYPDADIGVDIDEGYDVPGWSMEVCIRELLTNALEHNDSEPPTVVLSATTTGVADGMVAIDVRDNGPGIPNVERETLSRGHETDLEHGSSLGLWLVHWITTYLGGDLQIRETGDTGSTVRLVVPYGENVA